MEYEVVFTGEFEEWWNGLNADEQDSVDRVIRLLIVLGPFLSFPYSSGIQQSRYGQMRELRVQHSGRPYRVLYAFDPKRRAVLLLGGQKTGNRWYVSAVAKADRIFQEYLEEIETEGNEDDG